MQSKPKPERPQDRVERHFSSFKRAGGTENIKQDSIKAKFENGLLEIALDKTEPVKPKEIVDFQIKPDERERKKEWLEQLQQLDMFEQKKDLYV